MAYRLLWHPTAVGHKTAAIYIYIYICFSGGNVGIAALLKPATINTSFCADAIAVVEKNATIFELWQRFV